VWVAASSVDALRHSHLVCPFLRVAVVIYGSTLGDVLSAFIRPTRVHPCSTPPPVVLNDPHRYGDVRGETWITLSKPIIIIITPPTHLEERVDSPVAVQDAGERSARAGNYRCERDSGDNQRQGVFRAIR